MGEVYLEFEKPIAELKKKIAEWEELSATSNVDMSAELDMLRNPGNFLVSLYHVLLYLLHVHEPAAHRTIDKRAVSPPAERI